MSARRFSLVLVLFLFLPLATASSHAQCTPVGVWNWLNGKVQFLPDGRVLDMHNGNTTARWFHLGGQEIRIEWKNGFIDTLALLDGGAVMDGRNNHGSHIHVSCQAPLAAARPAIPPPPPAARPIPGACTPVGLWHWVDNSSFEFLPDGRVVDPRNGSIPARWTRSPYGGGRIHVSWKSGYQDDFTLSPDARTMDGINNQGKRLHVWCEAGR